MRAGKVEGRNEKPLDVGAPSCTEVDEQSQDGFQPAHACSSTQCCSSNEPLDCWKLNSVELSPTSFLLLETNAKSIMGAFQQFLSAEVATMSQKFKSEKQRAKAEIVTCGGLSCVVKMRVCEWSSIPNACTVELQRYDGDSVAFNHVYRQVRRFLCISGRVTPAISLD